VSALQLSDVIQALDSRYPRESAAGWDHVGLVTGDPAAEVTRVLFTVDVNLSVVKQAIEMKAQLIVAHHPLLFKPLDSVANSDSGRVLTELIKNDIALFTAHTNADVAWPGVSDAIATNFGVEVDAGVSLDGLGVGRIGSVEKKSLNDFASLIAKALPKTVGGVRVAGAAERVIERVAICGGAGDSLLEFVALTDADVYVTSDLRHHVTEEFVRNTGKALIDIPHWAAEWLWLRPAAELLKQDLASKDGNLVVSVSEISTDPWLAQYN
jgi:dinuclear metal center YbgI/SA1388 family protein